MKKVLILSAGVLLAACKEDVKDKTNEAIDKGGQAIERTANRVVDEVSAHINRDMGCKLELSEALKAKGVSTGKFYIEKDTVADKDNKLVLYLITENAFKGDMNFKVINNEGTELGRTSLKLDTKAGSAGYHDVIFDKRTDIESKSTISIY